MASAAFPGDRSGGNPGIRNGERWTAAGGNYKVKVRKNLYNDYFASVEDLSTGEVSEEVQATPLGPEGLVIETSAEIRAPGGEVLKVDLSVPVGGWSYLYRKDAYGNWIRGRRTSRDGGVGEHGQTGDTRVPPPPHETIGGLPGPGDLIFAYVEPFPGEQAQTFDRFDVRNLAPRVASAA